MLSYFPSPGRIIRSAGPMGVGFLGRDFLFTVLVYGSRVEDPDLIYEYQGKYTESRIKMAKMNKIDQ